MKRQTQNSKSVTSQLSSKPVASSLKREASNVQSHKRKLFGIATTGAAATGVGAVGAFGLCHWACQTVIAILAVFGITVAGMPLAFNADSLCNTNNYSPRANS